MSGAPRKNISSNLMEKEHVDMHVKQQCLQTGIYDISKLHPFIGSVIQCLDIEYSHMIPTLGVMFDGNGKKWKMLMNPYFFCKKLSAKERCAVLLHEIAHISHKHPFRAPFLKINADRRILMNIAMDMAINQYIENLPKGCKQCPPLEAQQNGEQCENDLCPGRGIFVEDYYDVDKKTGKKTPWDTEKPFEYYYHKLIERFEDTDPEEQSSDGNGEGQGKGQGKGRPSEFDSHHWDASAEEAEMMDATEELMKRAMQKKGLSYDKLPSHVKELLKDIDARRAELNYKGMILSAIKKHASGFDRKHTWTRRSRRFGMKSPGTKNAELPFLGTYIDTSGSISIQEANDFLGVIDNFLKVGSRKCSLNLWHTNVYHNQKYSLGDRISREVFESGGTDMEPTLRHIKEANPDLAIILTDGCYCDVEVENWLRPGEHFPQCIFIISRDGDADHPLQRLGETIKIPNTDHYGDDSRLEEQ